MFSQMEMTFLLFTFIQIWICFAQVSDEFQKGYFHEDNRYNNRLPTHGILWTLVLNRRLRCAKKCLQDHACPAYFYNGSHCHAYSSRMHDLVPTDTTPSMKYYENKGRLGNIAAGKPASMSEIYRGESGNFGPGSAVDGERTPEHTVCVITSFGFENWWKVDLQDTYYVTTIAMLSRSNDLENQIGGAAITVSKTVNGPSILCGSTGAGWIGRFESFHCPPLTPGRFVQLKHVKKYDFLSVCEVEVYSDEKP